SFSPATNICCRESRYCWQRIDRTDREGADRLVSLAPVTRHSRACAETTKAWPSRTATLARHSLQKDPRSVPIVLHDSPLLRTTRCEQAHRYSLPPISILSGSERFHPTLPQAPAACCRWAERYDSKRNLYFKHAA